jgi:hypothetical protein
LLLLHWIASAQSIRPASEPRPVGRDELAVYKTFINGYRLNAKVDQVYVVDNTGVLRPDEGDYATCMKEFSQPAPTQTTRRLGADFATACRVNLVKEPYRGEFSEYVSQLEDHRSTGSAGGAKPSGCSLGLSEIIFDKRHHRAALGYQISCSWGGGSTATLVYKRVGRSWVESKPYCATGIQ